MPGRTYSAQNSYRFGFNGKENDNETKGEGNEQDYGMRIYDPRVGRFLSVDPLTRSYPWNSPYSYAEGDVIRSIDLDGLEKFVVENMHDRFGRTTRTYISGINENDTKQAVNMHLKTVSGQLLTTKDVYEIHFRRGMPIAGSSKNQLSTSEQNVLANGRNAPVPADKNFDKNNNIQNATPQELGRNYFTVKGRVASVIPGSSSQTHQEFDKTLPVALQQPTRSSQNLGGADFVEGTMNMSSMSGGRGGVNPTAVTNYQTASINDYVQNFLASNNLDVGFVDRITLTVGNNTNQAQWNSVQQNLQATFRCPVIINVDPKIQMKDAGGGTGTSSTYLHTSVSVSGVQNGNINYADRGAIQRKNP